MEGSLRQAEQHYLYCIVLYCIVVSCMVLHVLSGA